MPLPFLTAAAAATDMAGSIANPIMQHFQNRSDRRWTEKMKAWERGDALADWNMVNEYNSPRAQMQRLQEAGLNPNLVYGHGATTEAGSVRGSSGEGAPGKAPEFNPSASNIVMGIYEMNRVKAQTDLTAKELAKKDEEIIYMRLQGIESKARTAATLTGTKRAELEYEIEQELRDTRIQAGKLGLAKTEADIKVMLDRNEREAVLNASNLREATERIITMRTGRKLTDAQINKIREEIELLKKEGRIKELDAKLADKGLRPGDSPVFRYIAGIIEQVMKSLGIGEAKGHPDQQPGESLDDYRRRKAIGRHQ